MGLEYRIIPSERKEISRISCDRCEKEIKREMDGGWNEFGKPYSCYHEPWFQYNYAVIRNTWGYHSRKDETAHEIILCEDCYDIVFLSVRIKITE